MSINHLDQSSMQNPLHSLLGAASAPEPEQEFHAALSTGFLLREAAQNPIASPPHPPLHALPHAETTSSTPASDATLFFEAALSSASAQIEPGLVAMLMLDTPSDGQHRLIHVQGNAALTGPNGAGKTTMVKAILLFSGTPPGRIPTGDGKRKFLAYYFPNDTSLVVFCYANHRREERLVVFYKTADGLRARMFRCGLRDELFFEGAGASISYVPPSQFKTRAAGLGIPHSNVLTQADAIAAMSGHLGASLDHRKIFGNEASPRDFSMVPPGSRLGDIAEICKAVEERHSTLQQLAEGTARSAMISSKLVPVDQAELVLSMKIDPALASLLPSMQGVSAANAAASEFDKASDAHVRTERALAWRAAARAAFEGLARRLAARLEEIERSKSNLKASGASDADNLNAHIAKSKNQSTQDGFSAEDFRQKSKAKTVQGESFRRKDAPKWRDKQSDRPLVLARIEQSIAEREALEGKSAEAAAEYRKRHLEEHEARASLDKDCAHADARTLDEQTSAQRRALESDRDKHLQEAEAQAHPAIDHLARKATQADVDFQTEARLAKNPTASAEAETDLRQAHDGLAHAHDKLAEATHKKSLADQDSFASRVSLTQARDTLARAQEATKARKSEWDKTLAWASPDPASPLAVIRATAPGAAEALLATLSERALLDGRVLSFDQAARSTWLGLDIDIEKLCAPPSGPAAREESIEHAESRSRLAFDNAHDLERSLRASADEREGDANQANARRAVASNLAQNAQSNLEMARVDKIDKEAKLRKAQNQAKSLAEARVQAARASAENAKRAADSARAHLDRLLKGMRGEFETKLRRLDAAKELGHAELDKRRKVAQETLASHKESVERQIQTSLRQSGVDPDKIQAKRREIDSLNKELADIERHEPLAREWTVWVESTEPSIANDDENAMDLERSSRAHADLARAMEAQLHELLLAARREIQSLEDEGAILFSQKRLCFEKMSQIVEIGSADASTVATLEGLEPQHLIQLHHAKTAELSTAREERKISLLKCHEAFQRHRGSPPDKFWDERKNGEPAAATVDAAEGYWCEAYSVWHREGGGETHLKALTSHARSLGAEVAEHLRRLVHFKLECAKTGRRIGGGLKAAAENAQNGGARFKSVRDLTIAVECELGTLPYFAHLSLAASEHEAWMESKEPAPPESLLKSLASLVEHARGTSFLRAQLDELVIISGSVVEVGKTKRFSTKQGISNLSSNGLSYLIVLMVQLAFLNQARANCAELRVVWALDELRDLDNDNVMALLQLLRENRVDLVCAFPDPDSPILQDQIRHIYSAKTDGTLSVVVPAKSFTQEARAKRREALVHAKARQQGSHPAPGSEAP